jgi:hypothetical protein
VAKSSIGKAVSRVGASGGGRTYGKTRPAAYYFVLSLIVVVGLAAVSYSRYELGHPASATTVYPQLGTTGYFAVGLQACGKVLPDLKTGTDTGTAYTVLANNVVQVSPTTAAESGTNANIGAFISGTAGLKLSTNEITFPNGKGSVAYTYKSGMTCPAGTKYAGKKAYPEVAYWENDNQNRPSISSDPSAVLLDSNMLVTLAFDPTGVLPAHPTKASINELLEQSPVTTTTTTIP